MADYASNYSPRYTFQYRSGGAVHSVTVRLARGVARDDEAVTTKMAVMYAELESALMLDFAFLSGTYYPEDAFLGFPVDLGTMAAAAGTNSSPIVAVHKAIQLRFECRGNLGGRTSLSIFGTNLVDVDNTAGLRDFRVTPGEVTGLGDFITALSELAPAFVPLGSTSGIWKNYANLKYNDHWVGELRKG